MSLTVLLSICATLLPLPLVILPPNAVPENSQSSGSSGKDSSEPFPCQSRPCGCRSAKQCWKKCCCFTHAQKVAWAKSNNVKVPDFVLAAEKERKNQLCSDEICSLSESSIDPAIDAMSPHIDQSTRTPEYHSGQQPDDHPAPVRTKWLLAICSAECQGQGPSSAGLLLIVIPEGPLLTSASEEVTEVAVPESERLPWKSLRPPLPPPKLA